MRNKIILYCLLWMRQLKIIAKKRKKKNQSWIGLIHNYINSWIQIRSESGMNPFSPNHNSFSDSHKNKKKKSYPKRNYELKKRDSYRILAGFESWNKKICINLIQLWFLFFLFFHSSLWIPTVTFIKNRNASLL